MSKTNFTFCLHLFLQGGWTRRSLKGLNAHGKHCLMFWRFISAYAMLALMVVANWKAGRWEVLLRHEVDKNLQENQLTFLKLWVWNVSPYLKSKWRYKIGLHNSIRVYNDVLKINLPPLYLSRIEKHLPFLFVADISYVMHWCWRKLKVRIKLWFDSPGERNTTHA
jgi:hypothetical protein